MPADRRRIPARTYVFFFVFFAAVLFLVHTPFLKLPYFWDEVGWAVPAALDLFQSGLFQSGAWIPHSTAATFQPPGLPAYLAACWSAAGYSIAATRIAMIALAAGVLLAAFLLAIRLSAKLVGAPAFVVVMLLVLSPLFYAQSMLAQSDLAAALFTSLALLFFLQDRILPAALASVALVMVSASGLVAPAVFVLWLLREKRVREALWFLLPALALAAWLLAVKRATGQYLGVDREFVRYQFLYLLHPVRFAVALVRRLYFLFVADFHWVGTFALLPLWRTDILRTRDWKITGSLVAAFVLLFSLTGGAMLDRYLLPVLPIVYTAMVAGITILSRRTRMVAQWGMAAGMMLANLLNPPYPFPLENNTAFTDSIKLQQAAAEFLEFNYADRLVVTAWPMAAALTRSEYGYVRHGLQVRALPDFRAATLENVDWTKAGVLVIYSRNWDPGWSLLQIGPFRTLRERFFQYSPELAAPPPQSLPLLEHVGHWARRGQWIDVYAANHSRERRRYFLLNAPLR
jgi:hypothetical protein